MKSFYTHDLKKTLFEKNWMHSFLSGWFEKARPGTDSPCTLLMCGHFSIYVLCLKYYNFISHSPLKRQCREGHCELKLALPLLPCGRNTQPDNGLRDKT